jgi:hypothetical protein
MFNRLAFEKIVSEKSPLTVSQFDQLFGGSVTAENKHLAWALMNLSPQSQFAVWQVIKEIPGAKVERVK